MPNHIHGIIEIVSSVRPPHGVVSQQSSELTAGTAGTRHGVSPQDAPPDAPPDIPPDVPPDTLQDYLVGSSYGLTDGISNKNQNQFGKTIPGSISAIIGQYKSSVTRWCNKNGFNFAWQSRFYDHIIRNEPEYERIEQYILNNVSNWRNDKFF
ncbi:MAG: transposase [Bacteroidales bacterium]|nr:transposase [Bacteroidales bacterium]